MYYFTYYYRQGADSTTYIMVGGGHPLCPSTGGELESYRVETGEWFTFTALGKPINHLYSKPIMMDTLEYGSIPLLLGGLNCANGFSDEISFVNGSHVVPLGFNFNLDRKLADMAAVSVRVTCD